MWPFNKKSECSRANSSTKCNLISSSELRKITNDSKQERLKREREKIKNSLKSAAEQNTEIDILLPKEFESVLLEDLAKCGIFVDLNSRKEWTSEALHASLGTYASTLSIYYTRLGTVQYWVRF